MHPQPQPDPDPGHDGRADTGHLPVLDLGPHLAAVHDAVAELVARTGADAWAAHRDARARVEQHAHADDIPVADDGEHGDIDALRAAYRAACDAGDRPRIRALSRRVAVHPDVHRRAR